MMSGKNKIIAYTVKKKKKLCKWKHTVCNHVGLAFFTQHNFLRFIQIGKCISSLLPFTAGSISLYGCSTV